jgi:hypothetical protein
MGIARLLRLQRFLTGPDGRLTFDPILLPPVRKKRIPEDTNDEIAE